MRNPAGFFGIKEKLILVFIVIKVIPLVLLALFASSQVSNLGETVKREYSDIMEQARGVVDQVGDLATENSIDALDTKAREAIERLTTDTAGAVAAFLYQRDNDIDFVASLSPDEEVYADFLTSRTAQVFTHGKWVLNAEKGGWVAAEKPAGAAPSVDPIATDNEREFHYRQPEELGVKKTLPLYREITFFDLDGLEKIKVTSSDQLSPSLRDISQKENTWCRAESYFQKLDELGNDDIYVSEVIGAYLPSPLVGPYTPEHAANAGIDFAPRQAAYAGVENPVGKRFQGIVRWVKPVVINGQRVGYVSLALDHTHLMEFTDHIVPTSQRYSAISDASTGNYAFMWDHLGRNISHPRDYFIVGYDPQTGDPAVPWLSQELYDLWQASGKSYTEFQASAPQFHNQSLAVQPAEVLRKEGLLGLDCRFLNFAPQCAGWYNLTRYGGSGSFVIFWSNLWKLTTAAAIPYYTGQYSDSPRGFGFVTIGANVHEFHSAASETAVQITGLKDEFERDLKLKERKTLQNMTALLERAHKNLTVSTLIMVAAVIVIAIWMASTLTRKIVDIIKGINLFRDGNLEHRLAVESSDEMGQLAEALNEMSDRLHDSMEQINLARQHAEESDRTKGVFLASMSHEIRSPLHAIIGMSGRALQETEDKKLHYLIGTVKDSAESLLSLLNDILDFSKVEAGELVIEKHLFDLHDFIYSTAKSVELKAKRKGLDFSLSVAGNVPNFARGDGLRFKQVLLNVLSNAVKFTERGAIRTEVDVIDSSEMDMRLRVTVEDTGIGIPDNLQAEVFAGFSPVDTTLSREHQGAGLGLAISRRLCQLMGGDVNIDCSENEGCTIVFTICLEYMQELDFSQHSRGLKPEGATKLSVLVVEDNAANRDLARMILEERGHRVVLAANGEEALQELADAFFDVIFMDIQMPKMDGLAATRIIRALERGREVVDEVDHELKTRLKNRLEGRHLAIVALTAHAMSGDREKCMAAGVDRYLTKPFMAEQVLAVLREV